MICIVCAQRDSYKIKIKKRNGKAHKKIPHKGNGIIKGNEKYNNNKKKRKCFVSVCSKAF